MTAGDLDGERQAVHRLADRGDVVGVLVEPEVRVDGGGDLLEERDGVGQPLGSSPAPASGCTS